MFAYERQLHKKGFRFVIGVDEAGRGPLAGPVVASAVLLRNPHFRNRIDDSKKLSPFAREQAYLEIIEKSFFGVGIVDEKVIDRVNILVATGLAMERAIEALLQKHCLTDAGRTQILVDGNVRLNTVCPYTNIICGDSRCKSIACASIIAKVTRDRIMSVYDKLYPQYGFIRHKGYPTAAHRKTLRALGLSPIHRLTFSRGIL